MNIAKYIDHTLLKPGTTEKQIVTLCDEALTYGFASVCVNSAWIELCTELLSGAPKIKVCTVVGFPFGANISVIKAKEAELAVACGAREVDMVMNIDALKSGNLVVVKNDIAMVRDALSKAVTLKVILETCLLTHEEKILACKIAKRAGADFVKTSTGFSTGGATVEDVALMRKTVGNKMGVKASGGIRDFATAKAILDAGANRLGCSASVAIVNEARSKT